MYSRLQRAKEKKLTMRIMIMLGVSIAVVVFFVFFGLNLLIGFSVFVESLRDKPPEETEKNVYIRPPVLNPIPEATNSARLVIRGFGTESMKVTLLQNDAEEETVTVDEDGTFVFRNLILEDGPHIFKAFQTDENGNRSDDSSAVTTRVVRNEPRLEIGEPAGDLSLRGEENQNLTIRGVTDEGNTLTINGRVVVVRSDGSFATVFKLSEGENNLEITATDEAGNTTKTARLITFEF